jgi:hypothetical protein
MHGGFEQSQHLIIWFAFLVCSIEGKNASSGFATQQISHFTVLHLQRSQAKPFTSSMDLGRCFACGVSLVFSQFGVVHVMSRQLVHVWQLGNVHSGFEQS